MILIFVRVIFLDMRAFWMGVFCALGARKGRYHDAHGAADSARRRVGLPPGAKLVGKFLDRFRSVLLVHVLAAAKAKDHFDLHVFAQEMDGALKFGPKVVLVGDGTQLHFFDLVGVLVFLGLLVLLGLLVVEATKIDKATNGRIGLAGHFNEIDAQTAGQFQGFTKREDTELFVFINHADLLGSNPPVNPDVVLRVMRTTTRGRATQEALQRWGLIIDSKNDVLSIDASHKAYLCHRSIRAQVKFHYIVGTGNRSHESVFQSGDDFSRAFRRTHSYGPALDMADIRPFPALRPNPELAAQICELPYDVMSSEEARDVAAGNPISFLHVSKPEIDLPVGVDPHDPSVYAKARENFDRLIESDSLRKDSSPCYYLYRLVMDGRSQTGLVAAASCRDYDEGVIKKHELTRPAKEDDRVRHMESLDSQTGPVFLTYRAKAEFDAYVAKVCERPSAVDFTASDGVRHTSWVIDEPDEIEFVRTTFAEMPALYVADGHHRSAAASRVNQSRQAEGGSDAFLTVTFPHDQMRILAYNRALKDLNGKTPTELLAALGEVFEIETPGVAEPTAKNVLGLYFDSQWRTLRFRPEIASADNPIDGLDVALLQDHVLRPIFGIDDPRTSDGIDFIGGIRGTGELERLVNEQGYACAFSMFPTSIEDLMEIADQDGLMPPKSTWFEPKLRDGMFCHML